MRQRAISNVIGILVGAIGFSFTPMAQAQFTANSQTNVISGVTSNWAGSYIVGSNTFLDAVQIASGGVLSNDTSYLGYETSGSNNVASVASVGSIWSNAHNLYVGYNGAANNLVITNGGRVVCGPNFPLSGYLGFNSSSSNNLLVISGTGSTWRLGSGLSLADIGDAYVGEKGYGNRAVITNGGSVYCNRIYLGDFASSSNNSVLVSGSGSVWSNSAELFLGYMAAGNSFVISNGGNVFTGFYGRIGEAGTGSSNNTMLVTGSNSLWKIGFPFAADLYVGYSGSGNSLIISNGGTVFNQNSTVGNFSSRNSVLVTGSGSVWSNSGIVVGLGGISNSLTIANGGAVFNANSATVGNSGSSCFAFVSGAGSIWSNGSSLIVGSFTAGNTVTITAGAKVISNYGTIGGAGNNVMAIIGSGSVWSNSADLIVGNGGTGNQFILFNGGSAYNRNAYLGNAGSSTVASTFGGGSVWNNSGNLYVGAATDVNHLQVGSGSTVIASNAYVGYGGGSFNIADVEGGNFYVTNAAHNAVLEVRCGQLNVSSGLLQVDVLVCTSACAHISHTGGTLIYGSLILDPNLDADNDGLPNGWEQTHGLDPLSGGGTNGPSGDPDGDGMSNLQEFLAGTDPTNGASAFRITSVVETGNDVLVTWTTGIGGTNELQAMVGTGNSGYATNNFADIFVVTNTVGSTTNFLDVGGATNRPARFYRVRLVP